MSFRSKRFLPGHNAVNTDKTIVAMLVIVLGLLCFPQLMSSRDPPPPPACSRGPNDILFAVLPLLNARPRM